MPRGKNKVVRGFDSVQKSDCNPLYLIQIFLAQTKVAQDSCQSSLRDVLASVVRNSGISISPGTPPDFMPALCRSPELAPQSPQLLGEFPKVMGHSL